MKLDRSINPTCIGKYGLVLNRRVAEIRRDGGPMVAEVDAALSALKRAGVLDDAVVGEPGEFFVIRLKDKYAGDALAAYAASAMADDLEYAQEVADMAGRSGMNSPWCKRPD